ncbi:MAG: zinc-ribbon domain-containing protein [Dehalococcoidia bacterium]
MNYEDKTITCQDCAQPFVFRAADQSYHAMKGFTNEPKRCASCRQARRDARDAGIGKGQRDVYPWYTPIVVKTSPSSSSPVANARATVAVA